MCTFGDAAILIVAFSVWPLCARAGDRAEETLTLEQLIALPEADLALVDIASMNLACATGLPGAESIDSGLISARLDEWAVVVKNETLRQRPLFDAHPEKYYNSWADFRMLVLTNTLQRVFGVAYNPSQITPVGESEGFDFTRSADLFIHGLVQGTGGTCMSMPVLYTAVGRRLGYPLKLVMTAEHMFLRWEEAESAERFNIEGTCRGYGRNTDEFFRSWPRPWSAAERKHGNYLKSLTPREELSVFLTTRADCLFFLCRFVEARSAYAKAIQLSPRNFLARTWLVRTSALLDNDEARERAEQIIHRHQHSASVYRSGRQPTADARSLNTYPFTAFVGDVLAFSV